MISRPVELSVRSARAMDTVDLTQVANQLGTAVLKASSGVVVKATGELAGPEGEAKLATLLQLLQHLAKRPERVRMADGSEGAVMLPCRSSSTAERFGEALMRTNCRTRA
eukprot:2856-Heterococcus_DN1.PRE.4